MTIYQAFTAGIAGEKLSRALTGTSEVSAGRSVVATGSGALIGGVTTGSAVVAASTIGATVLATTAAPLIIPVAVVAGVFSFVRSLWD